MRLLHYPPKLLLISFLFGCLLCFCACSSTDDKSSGESATNSPAPKSMLKEETNPLDNKGIGPIKNIEFDEAVNEEMVVKGKAIYEEKCIACHNLKGDMIGPSQAGVLKRRSPEWIMNLMLNPEEMLKKDDIAKKTAFRV